MAEHLPFIEHYHALFIPAVAFEQVAAQIVEQSEFIGCIGMHSELPGYFTYHLVGSQCGMVDKYYVAVALILMVQFPAKPGEQAGFAVPGVLTDQQGSPFVGNHGVFQADKPLLMLLAQIKHIRIGGQ